MENTTDPRGSRTREKRKSLQAIYSIAHPAAAAKAWSLNNYFVFQELFPSCAVTTKPSLAFDF